MDYEKKAEAIRAERPKHLTLNPPPLPYVGHISLQRRQDGGYLIAAIGYDDQAGQFEDGALAAELVDQRETECTVPRDLLAEALKRAHASLERLRIEAAFSLIADLGRDYSEEELITMLRAARRRAAP